MTLLKTMAVVKTMTGFMDEPKLLQAQPPLTLFCSSSFCLNVISRSATPFGLSASLSSASSLTTLYEPLLDMIKLEPDWRLEVGAVDEAAELLRELNWDLISSENEFLRDICSTIGACTIVS